MKDLIKEFIIPFLIVIIGSIILISVGLFSMEKDYIDSLKKYNNGICSKCGGTYEYSQAVGHKYETCYIYICNNCDNLIETVEYYGR